MKPRNLKQADQAQAVMPEMADWLEKMENSPEGLNPCAAAFGRGPEGVTCKKCRHLLRHKPGRNVYLKCDLRTITHGPATDHRAGWPACSRYEEKPTE